MMRNFRLNLNMNNVRLRNKMLMMYFVSVFIPVVLTNIIFYFITSDNIRDQKMHDISLAVKQIRDEFQDQIDAVTGISSILYNDTILWKYIEQRYDQPADYVENYNSYISLMLEKYSPLYKTIKEITIYTENDSIIYGGRVQPLTNVRQQDWYQRVSMASPSTVSLETISPEQGNGSETLSLLRRIGGAEGGDRQLLLLRIDFHSDVTESIFRNITLNGSLYLLQGDHILYTTTPSSDKEGTYTPVRKKGVVLFHEPFSASYLKDWAIAGEFQEKVVLADVRRSGQFVFYLALVNLLVPTLLIIWFNRSLHARLVRILKQMKRVKNQTFEPIVEPVTRDEIGQLMLTFNQMTLQIRSLINDVYVSEIQKKELELKRNRAQLTALQSQINPHFLFNALETIRMRSLIKQEHETARIIQNMAKIFRKSLTWGKDWVTVKEEIDLVVCFLEIQKYRFEDKLQYSIDVDPELEQTLIPKMTLQPLVENASIHGIEAVKRSGMIQVSVKKTEEGFICKVSDNGIGIEPKKLESLLLNLSASDEMGEHIGIANVYFRLKLYYGEAAVFRIRSEEGAGTCIEIIVRESAGIDND